MTFLKTKVWPVVGGLIIATIIMVIFGWINHFIFPEFNASQSWTAYLLPFLGWAVGAFEGGCTTAWLAGEKKFRVTAALELLLILGGVFDMITLGFPAVALVIGILILAIFPRLGHLALNTFEAKKAGQFQ